MKGPYVVLISALGRSVGACAGKLSQIAVLRQAKQKSVTAITNRNLVDWDLDRRSTPCAIADFSPWPADAAAPGGLWL